VIYWAIYYKGILMIIIWQSLSQQDGLLVKKIKSKNGTEITTINTFMHYMFK